MKCCFVVLLFLPEMAFCQTIRKIYLSENNAGFTSGIITVWPSEFPFINIAGYNTFRHTAEDSIYNSGSTTHVQRIGILLPGRKLIKANEKRYAEFGSSDTVQLYYTHVTNEEVNGRSALLSLANLFVFKKEDRIKQGDPVSTINYKESSGRLYINQDSSDFIFVNDRRKKDLPSGWLVIGHDTLFVAPVAKQYNSRGVIKPSRLHAHNGFILKKGDTVVAAIDAYVRPETYYISDPLDEKSKLIIGAFLFISTYTYR